MSSSQEMFLNNTKGKKNGVVACQLGLSNRASWTEPYFQSALRFGEEVVEMTLCSEVSWSTGNMADEVMH